LRPKIGWGPEELDELLWPEPTPELMARSRFPALSLLLSETSPARGSVDLGGSPERGLGEWARRPLAHT